MERFLSLWGRQSVLRCSTGQFPKKARPLEHEKLLRKGMSYSKFNVNVHTASGAAANALLPPTTVRGSKEVRGRRWMDIEFDSRAFQVDLLVVRVANLMNLERVVAASFRLYGELPT